MALVVRNPLANAGDVRDSGLIPGWGRPLEESTATHSSIVAKRFPWTKKPGGLYRPWGCKELDMNEAT